MFTFRTLLANSFLENTNFLFEKYLLICTNRIYLFGLFLNLFSTRPPEKRKRKEKKKRQLKTKKKNISIFKIYKIKHFWTGWAGAWLFLLQYTAKLQTLRILQNFEDSIPCAPFTISIWRILYNLQTSRPLANLRGMYTESGGFVEIRSLCAQPSSERFHPKRGYIWVY